MTLDDSLSRAVRIKLKEIGIKKGVLCIFSNEQTEKKLLGLNEDQAADPDEYRPLENMRVRVIPVLGTMPALFGQSIAATALCQLAGQPFTYLSS